MEILNITSFLGFAIRLALAIFLGFIVGFERQWTKHQAGILTNVIVCVGAYAYTAFSYIALGDNIDVTRIAAQVVSGVGFLGAGLILRDGAKISGLSTPATIWTTAAVGILCTLENIYYAIIVAAAIVIVHLVLHPLSDYINKKSHYNKDRRDKEETTYKISILCKESSEIDIRSHLIKTIREKNDVVPVIFTSARDEQLDKIIGLELGSDDYITKPYSPKELVLRVNNIIKKWK